MQRAKFFKGKANFLKNKMNIFFSTHSQIWIETAIYTLIGLVIIGIVLSIALPSIDRYKCEIILEQTITLLNNFNDKIIDVKTLGEGNRRTIPELRIGKGRLEIDSINDTVIYTLEECKLEYSEIGTEVKQGDIIIKTEKKGREYDISMRLSYPDLDLIYGDNEKKTFHAATGSYKLFVENNGTIGNKIQVIIGES